MKLLKKFLIIPLLIALLASCKTKVVHKGEWTQKINTEEISTNIIELSAKLGKDCFLFLEDSYISYNDEIKKVCLRYSSQKLLTFCEARKLIVDITEELLWRLNSADFLTYQFEQLPLTSANLDIRINFESFYGKYCDQQYVGLIWLQNNCVHFFAFDRKDIKLDWDHHRLQPYLKCKELVRIKEEVDSLELGA